MQTQIQLLIIGVLIIVILAMVTPTTNVTLNEPGTELIGFDLFSSPPPGSDGTQLAGQRVCVACPAHADDSMSGRVH